MIDIVYMKSLCVLKKSVSDVLSLCMKVLYWIADIIPMSILRRWILIGGVGLAYSVIVYAT